MKVLSFDNCTIRPDVRVWLADGTRVRHPGLSHVWDSQPVCCPEAADKAPARIDRECFFLGMAENFGHCVFEFLPRLYMRHVRGLDHLPLAVWDHVPARFLQLLSCIDGAITGARGVIHTGPAVFGRTHIATTLMGRDDDGGLFIAPEALTWLRERTWCMASEKPTRRIYARRTAKHRNIVNANEVERVLTRAGFETVDLAKLPVVEQIRIASMAETLVVPVGPDAEIGLWARGKVIELAPPGIQGPFGPMLFCHTMGLPYARVVGMEAPDQKGRDADYSIDLHQLKARLRA